MAWVISVRVTEDLLSQKGERALHSSYADDILGAAYRMVVDRHQLLPLPELGHGVGTCRIPQAVGA
jgi:hypothetical protein